MKSKLTITDWALSDRPREKYLTVGSTSLSDTELIAILLRSGTQELSAVDLAKQLLARSGNSLNQLAKMSIGELTQLSGIGKVKAITLHAAFELGRRRRAEPVSLKNKILQTTDVVELMQSQLAELMHEEFWVIYLNQASHIIRTERMSSGGWTATIVDVRMLMKRTVELNATAIVLCHNHPSGNIKPSPDDIKLTENIRRAAEIFNIRVIDHVIIHGDAYYSFCAEGML